MCLFIEPPLRKWTNKNYSNLEFKFYLYGYYFGEIICFMLEQMQSGNIRVLCKLMFYKTDIQAFVNVGVFYIP